MKREQNHNKMKKVLFFGQESHSSKLEKHFFSVILLMYILANEVNS